MKNRSYSHIHAAVTNELHSQHAQVFGRGESHQVSRKFVQVVWEGQSLSAFWSDSLRDLAMCDAQCLRQHLVLCMVDGPNKCLLPT